MKASPWILAGLIAGLALNAHAAGEAELTQEARALVKQYAHKLKHELKHALSEKGVKGAIGVCRVKAPDVSTDVSKESGWVVRRTSLKLRSLDDVPDKWEVGVMESFEKRKAAGEPVGKLEHAEVVNVKGKRWFRYMKAIPTRKVCLKCHGSDISEDVAEALDASYPFDQARGFKEGDIRGAFTLKRPLD